ncbi:HD domain-containing protein [Blastopirellula marina]|nr:HD domain-containing protein [Blastopirellula marina]
MDWDERFGMLTWQAAKLHAGQVRQHSGLPYIVHPLDVVWRISQWGIVGSEHPDTWIAALFHDTLEDTEATPETLQPLIGEQATKLVEALTFDSSLHEKHVYLDSFQDPAKTPIAAVVVKLADRLCNVEDFLRSDTAYAHTYFWKAESVFDAFTARRAQAVAHFSEKIVVTIENDIHDVESAVEMFG